jgi:hypothetical protein
MTTIGATDTALPATGLHTTVRPSRWPPEPGDAGELRTWTGGSAESRCWNCWSPAGGYGGARGRWAGSLTSSPTCDKRRRGRWARRPGRNLPGNSLAVGRRVSRWHSPRSPPRVTAGERLVRLVAGRAPAGGRRAFADALAVLDVPARQCDADTAMLAHMALPCSPPRWPPAPDCTGEPTSTGPACASPAPPPPPTALCPGG